MSEYKKFANSDFGILISVLLGKTGRKVWNAIVNPVGAIKSIVRRKKTQYFLVQMRVRHAKQFGIGEAGVTRPITAHDLEDALENTHEARISRLEEKVA